MGKLSKNGNFTVAATGDFIGGLPISCYDDEDYLAAIHILRDADVAYTNLETTIHNYEGYPAAEPGGTYMRSPPYTADELKWAGFDLVSCATNHICDYSYSGLFSTLRALDAAGIVHAGAGANLGEAREPKYLGTKKGRVAFISVCSTFSGWERAGNSRMDMPGRPGLNPLRFNYVVDSATMKELQKLCSKLQLWSAVFQDGKEVDIFRAGLDTARWKFVVGNEAGVSTRCHEQDFKGNILSVRNARRQADYVLVACHGHEFVQNNAVPAKFQTEFARACVDAGADAYLGNGPHQLRGIEIYKGKPIFYGLGSFVTHSRYITRFPADGYERVGLGPDSTPMDFLETRYRFHANEGYNMYAGGSGGEPELKGKESVIAQSTFNNGQLAGLKLYPICLSDKPQSQKPFTRATGDKARSIIDDLRELSAVYGTTIEYKDGIGIVRLRK